jgi:NAD dependent epimerase/dehydratase family enzyme
VANLSTKPKILVTDSAIELERDFASAGARVVRLRTGVILTPREGALARSLGRWRLGFRASGGNELPLSWITADELASVVLHALATESLEGGVCASSPSPSTLRELGATLRRVAGRRIVAAASSPFPEGGPAALLASGYRFRYPDLEDALRHMLGRSGYA